MKSNVCSLVQGQAIDAVMLTEVKKCAAYNELGERESLRLRLLAEELIGMLPNMSDGYEGEFWIENNGPEYELHASLAIDKVTFDMDEKFLSISKSGKNAAAKGIVGKIRSVMFRMFFSEEAAMLSDYAVMNFGMMEYDSGYAARWSLNQYQNTIAGAAASKEKEEAWDELEKSVIAKIADDVIVGIRGRKVDIIVKKTFS